MVISGCILAVLIMIVVVLFHGVLPEKDKIPADEFPQEYYIDTAYNYIDVQTGNECSAYASAYVMRHLGKQIDGAELYHDIQRVFGLVPVQHVVRLFQNYGYSAKAYHGDLNTMKRRLADGVPVIAFIRIPNDTHYVVIVGYDEEFIYLVDSIAELSNADGGWYNRKLRTEEFEEIWNTELYPVDNIYIVVRTLDS